MTYPSCFICDQHGTVYLTATTWVCQDHADVILDDSNIVGYTTWKTYADAREPGVRITIIDYDAIDTDDATG